jgi:hypothetical protein
MPSVGPLSAGFKQVPAGGYLTIVSSINVLTTNNVYSGFTKNGSGGSFTVSSPIPYPWAAGGATANFSSLLTAGRVLKDMGTMQVSSSRVFRKFKAVAPAAAGNGLAGGDAASANPDFGTFYLETVADGGDVPAEKVSVLARSA